MYRWWIEIRKYCVLSLFFIFETSTNQTWPTPFVSCIFLFLLSSFAIFNSNFYLIFELLKFSRRENKIHLFIYFSIWNSRLVTSQSFCRDFFFHFSFSLHVRHFELFAFEIWYATVTPYESKQLEVSKYKYLWYFLDNEHKENTNAQFFSTMSQCFCELDNIQHTHI